MSASRPCLSVVSPIANASPSGRDETASKEIRTVAAIRVRGETALAELQRALRARGIWTETPLRSGGVELEREETTFTLPIAARSRPLAAQSLRGLERLAGVLEWLSEQSPHPLLDRWRERAVPIPIEGARPVEIGPGRPPMLIAGPCAVESPEQITRAAAMAAKAGARLLRGGAFKPRTSPHSFQGLGETALAHLRDAARAHGLGVVTEVMSEQHVEEVAAHADLLQIGSRNMQAFSLLRAVGRCGKPVLLKRGAGADLNAWRLAAEHLLVAGAAGVIFCERGIRGFDPALRYTLDLAGATLLAHQYRLAVLVDPSHATGRRELVVPLARAALAAGVHGVMVEAHPDPGAAWSDAPQQLDGAQLQALRRSVASAVSPPRDRFHEERS